MIEEDSTRLEARSAVLEYPTSPLKYLKNDSMRLDASRYLEGKSVPIIIIFATIVSTSRKLRSKFCESPS